jgi:hypothetical protein
MKPPHRFSKTNLEIEIQLCVNEIRFKGTICFVVYTNDATL